MSQVDVFCHHCATWMGESPDSLTFLGMFKEPRDRNLVPTPRHAFRCRRCSWVNVFRSQANAAERDYRTNIELKAG